jgi:hypothetical protein
VRHFTLEDRSLEELFVDPDFVVLKLQSYQSAPEARQRAIHVMKRVAAQRSGNTNGESQQS